jgi:hypothetical protein
MSKEDFLGEGSDACQYNWELHVVPYDTALKAMDQWAKQQNSELMEALKELKEKYLFNQSKAQAKNNHIDETLQKVESVIKKSS